MKLVWDERKRRSNFIDHGLDFADASDADWEFAIFVPTYPGRRGEPRAVAIMPFRGSLISIVVAPLGREAISLISMRTASRRERRAYAETP